MKKTLLLVTLITALAAVGAALLARTTAGATAETPKAWLSLADSVQPMRAHFNANKDRPRFVALLSPT